MNKKAFIRILEASIAVIIIFLVLYTVRPQPPTPVKDETITIVQNAILDKLSQDEGFRNCIITSKDPNGNDIRDRNECFTYFPELKQQINSLIPPRFNNEVRVCEITAQSPCTLTQTITKSVYTKDTLVASSDKQIIIRVYLWEK